MSIRILHIESATKTCSVACSLDGKTVAFLDLQEAAFIHGEQLTLVIQEVLAKALWKLSDIAAISYSAGPGSYTGLRIGLSTAKGLCYALDIPLISVNTLACYHELAISKLDSAPDQPILCMLDARRMEVYVTAYDAASNECLPLHAAILEKDTFSEFEPFYCVGDAHLKLTELWENRSITFIHETISAKYQAKLAYEKFNLAQFEDLAYASPIYLKGANGSPLTA
ncbi:MAG: hypothetical protein RLZZ301_594 [Bacteroidota bacterium]|jgi:tRNA threonylcarbamoyladenosine biosynthesis protein TsaB